MSDNILDKKFIDFLLAAAKGKSEGAGGQSKAFTLRPPMGEFILLVNKKTANLTRHFSETRDLFVPKFFPPLHMFGQAQLSSGDVFIHTRAKGITLEKFLKKSDAIKTMASWPQDTFDDLMFQARLATKSVAFIDFDGGNFMIDSSSVPPKITIIDLAHDRTDWVINRNQNRPDAIIEQFFWPRRITTRKEDLELIGKLVLVAENAKFGSQDAIGDYGNVFIEEVRHLDEGLADKLRTRLNDIHPPEISTNYTTPPEITELCKQTLCLETATVGDVLRHLHKIADASRAAHQL